MKAFRLLVFAPLLALCGCGLYQIQTLLHSPGGYPTAATGTPIFYINYTPDIGNPVTGQGFQGFEVYYKFFANGQITLPSVTDTTTPDDLRNSGFLPVCAATDLNSGTTVIHSKPLIRVAAGDINSTFNITIDFSYSGTPPFTDPVVTYNGTLSALEVRRSIPDNNSTGPTANHPKAFVQLTGSLANVYSPGDIDVNPFLSSPANPINLVMYALSYGQSGGYDEWSAPTYLGVVALYFPQ